MDNIKQVVKDVRFLIATNCCDETIQARIENFINEHEQALCQPPIIGSVCDHNFKELQGSIFQCTKCFNVEDRL